MSNFDANPEIKLEEGVSLYEARMAQAIQTLGQKGFVMPQPPSYQTSAGVMPYRGDLPKDLTSLNDQELGMYMGLVNEWQGYVQSQLAEARSQLDTAKEKVALIEAKLRISYQYDGDGKKRSNPERDDYVGSDRRYVDAKSQVIYYEAIYQYIRAIAISAENSFSAVSRRITQRGQDIERERRNHGVTGGGNLLPTGPMFGGRGR